MNKKPTPAEKFLNQAYSLTDDKSKLDFYEKWADEYDSQMQQNLRYTSPQTLCNALVKFFDDYPAAVLDVGCGTGLTAQALTEVGFTNIDGLDYSKDMIAVAKTKGLYNQLVIADLNQPLTLADDCYGACICTGTFTHAHVGPAPIDELLRITKPAGFLACTVHRDLWQTAGFEDKFQSLEQSGKIKTLSFTNDAYFEDGEPEGLFCVYQVLPKNT